MQKVITSPIFEVTFSACLHKHNNTMQQYITILRGINVSGKNKIKMADLKQLLLDNHFEEVQTYIQSGNIVFQTSLKDPATAIHQLIKKSFGYDIPVLTKTRQQWENAIKNNPLLHSPKYLPQFMHFTFLAQHPSLEQVSSLPENTHKDDYFTIHNDVIYIYCPNGYGKTKFNNNFFEKKLNISATTRNYKTTLKLLDIATNKP